MKIIIPHLSIAATFIAFLVLFISPIIAKSDSPAIKKTTFEHELDDVFYFDDSNILLGVDRELGNAYRSEDAGETWDKIDDDGLAGKVLVIYPHPWDNQRAYILSDTSKHWITKDQGKSWKSFNSHAPPSLYGVEPLKFHGRDPKKVIFNGRECAGICIRVAYYTEDDFATTHSLGAGVRNCQWAVSTPQFGSEIAKVVDDRVFCIRVGLYSDFKIHQRLTYSNDYFKNEEIEPAIDNGRAVPGVISMAAVKSYIVVAAKAEGTDELALYVTADGSKWHHAEFGEHKIKEDAYTILESTNYSMQVDVLGAKTKLSTPMGHLFTSNSNGTYFTKNIDYTNRNIYGRVDFEKVSNIQGIVLVNIVDNAQKVETSYQTEKQIVSRISFDDGRTFEELKVKGERLHLHSVTEQKQIGRVFSSPAPGIVMGVGNTGKYLKNWEDGSLFVSDDAGRTWIKALDGGYFYEFGNSGAILAAIKNEGPTNELHYSLNHGKDWSKAKLEEEVRVQFLTTVPDSTTRKFLMLGISGVGDRKRWHIFKIDFDGLHERSCGDKDFEKWPARVDDDGKPSCVMGHKQFFRRRKADADCFIDADFKDPEPEFEPCVCTEEDFECDFNFVRDSGDKSKCIPEGPLKVPEGQCKSEKDTFKGSSGFRLIPGNNCLRKGGKELDKEVERSCADTVKKPASGVIGATRHNFDAHQFGQWAYLDRVDTVDRDGDETILMRDSEQRVWISKDHGKIWKQILKGEKISAIAPNPHFYDSVYFLTGTKTVHYSIDRGENFDKFEAREAPSTARDFYLPLKFHPAYKDWLLWYGSEGRGKPTNVWYTQDRGDDWRKLVRAAKKCEFRAPQEGEKSDHLIFCANYEDENPKKNLMLTSSNNFYADSNTHFNNILNFATMAEFIVVAAKEGDSDDLKVDGSADGKTFAAAEFPKNFRVDHQVAYTVLDSSTHAVFLHVTVNPNEDQEYGSILKSNSNGTSYVLSLSGVNRDGDGYVDFEKMLGLEGVAMVNVVTNTKEVDGDAKKLLKSKITHNDGAGWALIPPPMKDAVGSNYKCVSTENEATDKCSLHLHSYTERLDKSATFSSPSAVGLMIAVGNVGEFLGRRDSDDTDTFITRDAGITWHSVKKGPYLWEYGDQGSVIVIVPEAIATRSIFYTLDEGQTWKEFEFSKADMIIESITTLPSDNSLNFLLWGKETGAREVSTVNLDFSQLKERQRQCVLDENNPVNDDYELWEPKHPMQQQNCLFGHVSQYHRKRPDADCYNGKKFNHLHKIARNCSCIREDFECDYNYQMQNDGTCQLVEGLEPKSHLQFCKDNPDQREFWKVTGYRKVPLSTCEGGQELDKIEVLPCPGYEEEFQRKHGLGGAALFFAVVIPIAAACGVGYWVWQRYQAYGLGGFGQIRLGESMSSPSSSSGGQSPFIAVPVAIIAGTWAVAKAIPLLASSLFRSAKGYVPVGSRSSYPASGPYRSRDAFSSRRQDYSSAAFVEDDELLGDDDELGEDEV